MEMSPEPTVKPPTRGSGQRTVNPYPTMLCSLLYWWGAAGSRDAPSIAPTPAPCDAAAGMRRNVLLAAAAAVYDDFSPLGHTAAGGSSCDDACYSPSLECPSLSDLLMSSEEEDLLL